MSFPNTVNVTQAIGIAGDLASAGPRVNLPSMSGGWIAGPNGVTVGCFVWGDTSTRTVLSNAGTGAPDGIVIRAMQGNITPFLSEFAMTIPPGREVGDVLIGGMVRVKNAGSSAVTPGMKAFANNTNGTVSFAAAGTTVSGSTETKWVAETPGAASEIVTISNTPLG